MKRFIIAHYPAKESSVCVFRLSFTLALTACLLMITGSTGVNAQRQNENSLYLMHAESSNVVGVDKRLQRKKSPIFGSGEDSRIRALFRSRRIQGFDIDRYNDARTNLPSGVSYPLVTGQPLSYNVAKNVVYLPNNFGRNYLDVNNPNYRYGAYADDLFVYDTVSNTVVDVLVNVFSE